MKKRNLILPLTAGLLASCLIGCGGVHEGEQEDPDKANLTVATLDKGIGTAWLTTAAEEFMKIHANSTDFQEGRTGVKVIISGSTSYNGSYIENQALNKDIYFTEGIDYRNLVKKGKFLDITEIMDTPLTDYDENKTIKSKLDATMDNYLNVDGKYYGIPFYDSFYGLVYDMTLWDKKGFYLSKTGQFVRKNGDLSLGTDNIAGTLDDGLPATYEEFGKLIKKLRDSGVTPFLTANNGLEYTANYLFNVYADYEGLENMKMTIDFNGTATDLVAENGITFNVDGSLRDIQYKPATAITDSNAYELTRQAGHYHALSFLKDILLSSSDNYYTDSAHTVAQQTFVYGSQNQKPYGMIIEGSWWENEARNTIQNYYDTYGKRSDYAIMPIPFLNAEKAAASNYKHTYLSLSQSFGIVSASTPQKKLALEFMKFLHTDKMMSKFTQSTSITRPLNYEIAEEDQAGLSTYAKSLIDLKKNANIFYPYSTNKLQLDNPRNFTAFHWAWDTRINGNIYYYPWQYFVGSKDENKTALKYFDGQYEYFSGIWSSLNR